MFLNRFNRRPPPPSKRSLGRPGTRRRPAELWEACESRTLLDGTVFHIAIANAPPVERPDIGSVTATFTLSLTPANIEAPISVDFTTADGTAKAAANDYVPNSGTVTFPPEATTETVQVQVPAKTTAGPTLTFFVDLSNPRIDSTFPSGTVVLDNNHAIGTILNDNHAAGQVQFSAANYTVNPSTSSAQITIDRVNGRASGVGVKFTTTTGGTAIPGVDYTPVTTTVTFGLDQTTATVSVPINTAALSLGNPTVALLLENPTGGARLGAPGTATLTIQRVNPLIVTTTADTGIGSLRVAITFADSFNTPTPPEIDFAIVKEGPNPHTIAPNTPLPAITRPMTIDATSQPGFVNQPVIVLDGTTLKKNASVTNRPDGLDVTGGGTSLLGLAIGAFSGSAVVLEGPGSNRVVGDVLGTDPAGQLARPNGGDGVLIIGSPGNTITNSLISGNGNVGVDVLSTGATGNFIENNLIGTNLAGTAAMPNGFDGVFVENAHSNTVANNLISGNGNTGVQVFGAGASGNTIQGNKLGTNAAGSAAVPNEFGGVFLNNAPHNIVANNLVSGNGNVGIQVFSTGAAGNVVQNNLIGTNLAGSAALPNALDGVFLNNAPGNTVSGNVISGNRVVGLQSIGAGATGNSIVANKVGTDAAGLVAIPNGVDGVFLNNSPGNTLANNLISGNGNVGLQILGAGAAGNVVNGNVIGLNARGLALANAYGVFLNGAAGPGNGGPQARNVIRGNRISQVFIANATPTTTSAQGLITRRSAKSRPKTG